MHLSSTVFTFNKPGKEGQTFAFFCVFLTKSSKEESQSIKESQNKVTAQTVLTAQGPTCRFSSFQTALLISCCTKKEIQRSSCWLLWFNPPIFFFKNRIKSRENSLMISQDDHQVVIGHPGLVTYVCGCAGSSPRVTLLPWISLKHFSQKWYLSAIRPYLGELQPAHTVAAQAE